MVLGGVSFLFPLSEHWQAAGSGSGRGRGGAAGAPFPSPFGQAGVVLGGVSVVLGGVSVSRPETEAKTEPKKGTRMK